MTNRYAVLIVESEDTGNCWRFRYCYLADGRSYRIPRHCISGDRPTVGTLCALLIEPDKDLRRTAFTPTFTPIERVP